MCEEDGFVRLGIFVGFVIFFISFYYLFFFIFIAACYNNCKTSGCNSLMLIWQTSPISVSLTDCICNSTPSKAITEIWLLLRNASVLK